MFSNLSIQNYNSNSILFPLWFSFQVWWQLNQTHQTARTNHPLQFLQKNSGISYRSMARREPQTPFKPQNENISFWVLKVCFGLWILFNFLRTRAKKITTVSSRFSLISSREARRIFHKRKRLFISLDKAQSNTTHAHQKALFTGKQSNSPCHS